jgi:hypothetical protein
MTDRQREGVELLLESLGKLAAGAALVLAAHLREKHHDR